MKQESVLQIGQVKQERFFQTKLELTNHVRDFIIEQLSYHDMSALEREYKKQIGSDSLGDHGMFQFWFMFFHRFPNGLRGVEWFSSAQGKRISRELQEMLEVWKGLVPRFIQIVDYDEAGVFVEDILTKEKLHMPYAPTMPKPIPWGGALCLLEEMGGGYYINGMTVVIGPHELVKGIARLKELLEEIKQPYEQIVREHYIELLEVMSRRKYGINEQELTELEERTLHYKIIDMDGLFDQLAEDSAFSFDYWEQDEAEISFTGNWQRYEDNVLPLPLYVSQVYGSMKIGGNMLQFTSINVDKTKQFTEWIERQPRIVGFSHEDRAVHQVPKNVVFQTYSIRCEEEVPPQFAAIPQEVLSLEDGSLRLAFLHNLSLEEAVEQGYGEQVEMWLREREFNSFRMQERKGYSSVTADYNTIRRQLGLTTSPFVTLGDSRETRVTDVPDPFPRPSRIREEDVHFYESLGFTPETAQYFFALDVLQFFKDKVLGKSEATYHKYRTGLSMVVSYLSSLRLPSWGRLTENHWRELLSYYYLADNEDASLNQLKAVLTTIKAFIKWLDKKYGTKHAPEVIALIKELEPKLHNTILLWNYYAPSSQRRYVPSILQANWSVLMNMGEQEGIIEGLFQIKKLTSSGMTVQDLEDDTVYQLSTPIPLRKLLEKDMLISGMITESSGRTKGKIVAVERVFPGEALEYIPFEIVV